MRWRFADRVTAFEPWTSIEGRKSVSLEEYSLLEPLGREGEFPESLLLESCIQFSRWLIISSSAFGSTGELISIGSFTFERVVCTGEVIFVRAEATALSDSMLEIRCEAATESGPTGAGTLHFKLCPLWHYHDAEALRILWTEIRGQAA